MVPLNMARLAIFVSPTTISMSPPRTPTMPVTQPRNQMSMYPQTISSVSPEAPSLWKTRCE